MRLPVLLGQPVQKLGDLIAEVLDDLLHGDGRVLDGVVQEGSGQTVSSSPVLLRQPPTGTRWPLLVRQVAFFAHIDPAHLSACGPPRRLDL